MAIAALVISGLMVGCVGVTLLASRNYATGAVAAVIGLLVSFAMCGLGAILPPVFVTGLSLFVLCLAQRRHSVTWVRSLVLGSVAIGIGLATGLGLSLGYVQSVREMRQKYPLVSVESRLAYESHPAGQTSQGAATGPNARFGPPPSGATAWSELNSPASDGEPRRWSQRGWALEQIHGSYVDQFINAPGFGIARMVHVGDWALEDHRQAPRLLPGTDQQSPGPHPPGPLRTITAKTVPPPGPLAILESDLSIVHQEGLHDFFDPDDAGFVIDRDHVAGFIPHRFSEELFDGFRKTPKLVLQRLELVSLRRFGHPMVYVTNKKLPQMDELQNIPTRELNTFEAAALDELAKGEELAYAQKDRSVLALGALRAREQCTKCHAVERGALLGAFTYEFRSDSPQAKPST